MRRESDDGKITKSNCTTKLLLFSRETNKATDINDPTHDA